MITEADEPAALYEVRDDVAIVTPNRPGALNAVNADLSTAVGEGLAAAANDANVRVVVVTGTGRVFRVGADLRNSPRRSRSLPTAAPSGDSPASCGTGSTSR